MRRILGILTQPGSRLRRCHHHDQADDDVLSIRGPEVSLGSLGPILVGRNRVTAHVRGRFPRQIHINKMKRMLRDSFEAPSRRWRGANRLREA